jgi:hypothetical protein
MSQAYTDSVSRVIGHYIDSFNNEETRKILYNTLTYLLMVSGIQYIKPNQSLTNLLKEIGLTTW